MSECLTFLTEGQEPNGTEVTTDAATPTTDALLIAVVDAAVGSGTAPTDPVSVSGWSLTWQKIDGCDVNNVFSVRHHTVAYVAKAGVSPGSGAFTASDVGVTAEIHAAVFNIQQVNIGAAALDSIVQFNHEDDTSGVDTSSTVTMSALADPLNLMVGIGTNNAGDTPGGTTSSLATFVFEFIDSGGLAHGVYVFAEREGGNVDFTFTNSSRNGGIAFEVSMAGDCSDFASLSDGYWG